MSGSSSTTRSRASGCRCPSGVAGALIATSWRPRFPDMVARRRPPGGLECRGTSFGPAPSRSLKPACESAEHLRNGLARFSHGRPSQPTHSSASILGRCGARGPEDQLDRGRFGGASGHGPGAGGGRRAVDHRRGGDRLALPGLRGQGGGQRPGGAGSGRVVPARLHRARRDAARPGRLRGRQAAARRRGPHAAAVPHGQGRHRGQAQRARPRRRLRHQAVQPGRGDRPRAHGAAPQQAGHRSRRGAALRRPGARRPHPRGLPRRHQDPPDRHRVPAAALPDAQPAAGAVQGPDPRPRLGPRLRRRRERGRDVRQLPAAQARPHRAAADPHHPPGRLLPAAAAERGRWGVRRSGPPRPLSLRGRLLALLLVLLFFGLAVADLATYAALRSFLLGRVDQQLDAADGSIERVVPGLGGHGVDTRWLRQLGQVAPGVFVEWRDADGGATAVPGDRGRDGEPSSPRLPDQLPSPQPRSGVAYLTVPSVEPGGPAHRARVAPVGFGRGTLVVALPLGDLTATLQRLLLVEALVTATVLALAVAVGLWLVRLGLRPLDDISATAATIARGDLTGRVARSEPDTEVGRLGQALNLMLAQIEAAFAERQASEARLRQSEERLRRFAGDASHELRTPLAAIRAYAELFRRGADRHPEDLPRLLRRIESEAARMGGLVDDLLLLARLDQGRPLERHPVDLGAVAAEAVEAARAVEPGRPLELGIGLTDSVEVLGDQDRLRQVVDNLLGNVRAHTPGGTPARVRVWSQDGTAVVEVADDGPGLTMEQAERVFERFYRADSSRSRAPAEHGREGGSGLGLAIVAAIAAAHGGRALVRSTPGDGAVFRVELPLLAEAAVSNGNGRPRAAEPAALPAPAPAPPSPPA